MTPHSVGSVPLIAQSKQDKCSRIDLQMLKPVKWITGFGAPKPTPVTPPVSAPKLLMCHHPTMIFHHPHCQDRQTLPHAGNTTRSSAPRPTSAQACAGDAPRSSARSSARDTTSSTTSSSPQARAGDTSSLQAGFVPRIRLRQVRSDIGMVLGSYGNQRRVLSREKVHSFGRVPLIAQSKQDKCSRIYLQMLSG